MSQQAVAIAIAKERAMMRRLHIVNRAGVFYWRRRLSAGVAHAFGRLQIRLSLKTRDPQAARRLGHNSVGTDPARVNPSVDEIASSFYAGTNIREVWQSAKEMMAAKALSSIITQPEFASTLEAAVNRGLASSNIDALLSIDLIVRLSNANRKLRPVADRLLRPALQRPIPPLSLVAGGPLPPDAKASKIRENVASALEWADGDWFELL